MSDFFVLEIKPAKMDNIFNFLKDCFSVMSDPMDMTFSLFLDTNVRLLKNITLQFFSKYSKSYNKLDIKWFLKLNSP